MYSISPTQIFTPPHILMQMHAIIGILDSSTPWHIYGGHTQARKTTTQFGRI